ncbi:MAG: hypothetical protein KGL97_02110 [Alphaproteobacteria bacterium]|nr:hypothetical protein [Alphaproteobacteria bacterium]
MASTAFNLRSQDTTAADTAGADPLAHLEFLRAKAFGKLSDVESGPRGWQSPFGQLTAASNTAEAQPAAKPETPDSASAIELLTKDRPLENLEEDPFRSQRLNFVVPRDVSFFALQEWEGAVLDIAKETFTARLLDVTAKRKIEDEVAEFAISDLSDDDRQLLAPGAIFRWTIGYQRAKGGTKRRVSEITFRRLPQWTTRDIDSAKAQARELSKDLLWEQD